MPTSARFSTVLVALLVLSPATSPRAATLSFQGLGFLPGGAPESFAHGVSADGSVVVGDRRSGEDQGAFRWTEASGVVGLGHLPTFPEWSPKSAAFGVSADGSIVVGDSSSGAGVQQPIRWEGDTKTGLGDLPLGELHSGARAISADGAVIVGFGNSAQGQEAFRWTASDGMVGLGDLPGGTVSSIALAVSADGSVIVGNGRTDLGTEAFIWDAVHGMRRLQSVLGAGGLDLTGWTLTSARGISADGLTIVGYGINPSGQTEAWRATLVPLPASWLFMATGLAWLGRRYRRRTRRRG